MANFSTKQGFLLVPSNKVFEELKYLDKFLILLDNSGVSKIIINEYKKNHTRCDETFVLSIFATIVYSFSQFKSSLREMENLCIFDYRIIYLMNQKEIDHSTFGKFINTIILPNRDKIFFMITQEIIKELKLNVSNQYIDGTKIEANANKYKFVWKPTTFHKRLNEKVINLIVSIDKDYVYDEQKFITSSQLLKILDDFSIKENININEIPSGKGIRISSSQRKCKIGYQYLNKLIEYENKTKICGENRNSYYKTDHDATAMALKTDYYSGHGTNTHAAYNVQIFVSAGIITCFGVYQDRTDYYTLIKMLDKFYLYNNNYPKRLCGDSGYGVYKNYKYLYDNKIENYLKFQQWNGESTGKNPQLFFINENDEIECLNKLIGEKTNIVKNHPRQIGNIFLKFDGCNDCNYSNVCKKRLKEKNKTKDYRILEINLEYEKFKRQARSNLLSPTGIKIRVNRSIQVEGAFGQIKQNMNYTRFRRRNFDYVETEITLMCLGRNIRKLLSIFKGNDVTDDYWNNEDDIIEEVFPKAKKNKIKKDVN